MSSFRSVPYLLRLLTLMPPVAPPLPEAFEPASLLSQTGPVLPVFPVSPLFLLWVAQAAGPLRASSSGSSWNHRLGFLLEFCWLNAALLLASEPLAHTFWSRAGFSSGMHDSWNVQENTE